MNINKAQWVTDGDNVRLSMPIAKVDKERRIVSGFATLDNVDKQGDVVPLEASIRAFQNFRGNIREMHQPIAVGKVVSFKEDKYFDPKTKKFYNGVYVSAYVSKGAQDTWEKVLDGTLTGFSIGGSVKKWDDSYDERMDKSVRVIEDYELHELSLVDNPANQYANIISIEKNQATGYLTKTTINNVFWCNRDDIVQMTESAHAECPSCNKTMTNIGFVENSDSEQENVVKFLVDRAKGEEVADSVGKSVVFDSGFGEIIDIKHDGSFRLSTNNQVLKATEYNPVAIIKVCHEQDGKIITTERRVIKNVSELTLMRTVAAKDEENTLPADEKLNKEVSPMADEVIETAAEVEAEAEAVVVIDEVEDAPAAEAVEEPTEDAEANEEEVSAEDVETEEVESVEKSEDPSSQEEDVETVTKSDDAVVTAIADIKESVASAFNDLAATVKALSEQVAEVSKSITTVSGEVDAVKGKFDEFGKRVDAVEHDTAFRKSGDLGEIVQEEPTRVQKSLWGGRFLTNADLFK